MSISDALVRRIGRESYTEMSMRLVILPTDEMQPGPLAQSHALVALGRLLDEMARYNTLALSTTAR